MLSARCVHMILQAEHALMRERLDALSAHLRFGRMSMPGAQAEWSHDWQNCLAVLIRLDRHRHQPKVGHLCRLLEVQGAVAGQALGRYTQTQHADEVRLARLQLHLIGPWTGLPDAGARLIELLGHWRTALLDRWQTEQQLLQLADRLLNRDDWSALASAVSRLTYLDGGVAEAAPVRVAEVWQARRLGDGDGTTGAVRQIWPMRIPASVRRLPQGLRHHDAERLRPRSVLLRRPAGLATSVS